jgi:hypothetical protein
MIRHQWLGDAIVPGEPVVEVHALAAEGTRGARRVVVGHAGQFRSADGALDVHAEILAMLALLAT